MFKSLHVRLLLAFALVCGGPSVIAGETGEFSRFAGFQDFSNFTRSQIPTSDLVLLSPEVKPGIHWNQLIASWNATASTGTWLKVEARASLPGHETKFYTLGIWSPDNALFPRTSVRGQKDADGRVETDTLALKTLADGAQIRITLGGTNGALPTLKYLGLSFCNTRVSPAALPPNQAAWGKSIPTPERSQHAYPQEKGWCSPTSLAMALARWSEVLHRPEMDLAVPLVAAEVYDTGYAGTGNWPFNTAFAGSFDGMRSCVTRFDDLAEVEGWIAAGIPVILSARWDWLKPGRPFDDNGHLVVCIGFTPAGDVIINDPAGRLEKNTVRQVYRRADVIRSWGWSHNTVYLLYPTGAELPADPLGQW